MGFLPRHRSGQIPDRWGPVTVNVYDLVPGSHECTQLWLDANLESEELTLDQKCRLFKLRLEVEAALAKKRYGGKREKESKSSDNSGLGAMGGALKRRKKNGRSASIAAESLGISADKG